jgi:hypothetical protein
MVSKYVSDNNFEKISEVTHLTLAWRAAIGFMGVTASLERRSFSDDAERDLDAEVSFPGGFKVGCMDIVGGMVKEKKRRFDCKKMNVCHETPRACGRGSW